MKPIRSAGARALALLVFLMPAISWSATHDVSVTDNRFTPDDLTIQVGDTVRWINGAGGAGHDIDSEQGLWATPPVASEWTFEFTFNDVPLG